MSELVLVVGILGCLAFAVWVASQWAKTTARLPEDRLAQLETKLAAYRREVQDLDDHVGRWGRRAAKRAERDDVSPAEAEPLSRDAIKLSLRKQWVSSKASKRA